MAKKNKVKQFTNLVKSFDINQLYKVQNYVSVSKGFFKELEIIIDKSNSDSFYNSDDFENDVNRIFNEFKTKCGLGDSKL